MEWTDARPPGGLLGGVEFVWYAAPGRRSIFQWVTQAMRSRFGRSHEGLYLALLPNPDIHVDYRFYRPLSSERSLFITFANTPPTPEDCLKFANRFGPLGARVARRVDWNHEDRNLSLPVHYPGANDDVNRHLLSELMEPFDVWQDEIARMKHLVTLWLLADRHDKALADFVTWDGGRVYHQRLPKLTFGGQPEIGEGIWGPEDMASAPGKPSLFTQGDLVGPALLFVQRQINRSLGNGVLSRLHWSAERHRPELTMVPNHLIDAMYVQFAQAIAKDKVSQYRQCPVCLRSFEVARGAARSNRNSCSTTCRTYLYRRRMAKARELHGKGDGVSGNRQGVGRER